MFVNVRTGLSPNDLACKHGRKNTDYWLVLLGLSYSGMQLQQIPMTFPMSK